MSEVRGVRGLTVMTANAEYLIAHGWKRIDHGVICGVHYIRWQKGDITCPEKIALEIEYSEHKQAHPVERKMRG